MNETAKNFAKGATARSIRSFFRRVWHSKIKIRLFAPFTKQRQDNWNLLDKGRYTYNLVPLILLLFTPSFTTFLTGHGLFGAYLFKFWKTLFLMWMRGCCCYISLFLFVSFNNSLAYPRPPVPPDGWLINDLSLLTLLSKLKNIFNFFCDL